MEFKRGTESMIGHRAAYTTTKGGLTSKACILTACDCSCLVDGLEWISLSWSLLSLLLDRGTVTMLVGLSMVLSPSGFWVEGGRLLVVVLSLDCGGGFGTNE